MLQFSDGFILYQYNQINPQTLEVPLRGPPQGEAIPFPHNFLKFVYMAPLAIDVPLPNTYHNHILLVSPTDSLMQFYLLSKQNVRT